MCLSTGEACFAVFYTDNDDDDDADVILDVFAFCHCASTNDMKYKVLRFDTSVHHVV
jgi:hypothetical protein